MDSVVHLITALFVFFIMVDPSDKILHLKLPLFALLLVCCMVTYLHISKTIGLSFALYGILIITSVIGFLMGYDSDHEMSIQFYKSFIMITLLPWIHHLKIIERIKYPAIFISIAALFIYVVVIALPNLYEIIYIFVHSDRFMGTIMMGKREILGMEVSFAYYTSAPVLLLFLGVVFENFLYKKEKKARKLILLIITLIPLMLGGTRAMMLSALAVIAILFTIKLSKSGKAGFVIALTITLVLLVSSLFIINALFQDRGETSLEDKSMLTQAFYRHLHNHPETLIWGNGVGATFDSLGVRGDRATLSELSYFEIVRWFGLPLAFLFLLIYTLPLFLIYKKRKTLLYAKAISIGYIFYLFLSGTNPYLFSSNGLLALLAMYSYALNPHYEKQIL